MKKVTAIILAFTILGGLFAACGKESDGLAAEKENISMILWCSETEGWQTVMKELTGDFIKTYADEANITIEIGAQSEATVKDTVLNDVEAAADVFFFADDQLAGLVAGKALQPVDSVDAITEANNSGSIEAGTIDGTLYAYPATASNGYFLYYDSNVLSEEDVDSMDSILARCREQGKYFSFDGMGAWVSPYTFFAGAGYTARVAEDGVTTTCDWNDEGGADVVQAMLDLFADPSLHAEGSDEGIAAMVAGDCAAIINGTWNSTTISDALGDGFACAKLPTYTLNGEQVQMGSFAGYKYAGVSAYSANVGWAMRLAEHLTSEQSQIRLFQATGEGPANIRAGESDAVMANPAIAALSAQSGYATTQTVSQNYWTAAAALHQLCVDQNPDKKSTQQIVDEAVAGISAVATE